MTAAPFADTTPTPSVSRSGRRAAGRRALGLLPCLGIGVAALLLILGLYLVQPAMLQQLDRQSYDLFLRLTAGGKPPPGIVIVDIDEASITSFGQWPWPRYLLAALLEQLDEAGSAAVGLDILFSEADRTSMVHVQAMLERFLGLETTVAGLPDEARDNDLILADTLSSTPAVLGMYLRFASDRPSGEASPIPPSAGAGAASATGAAPAKGAASAKGAPAAGDAPSAPAAPPAEAAPPPPGLAVLEREPRGPPGLAPLTGLARADSGAFPLPVFVKAAPVAFYNAGMDRDGLLRRAPLVLAYRDDVYPSLAVRALMRARGVGALVLETGADGLERLRLGDLAVPVSHDGTMPVLFRGPGFSYPYVSAADILSGKADASLFRDAVVFVGTSAVGLRDIRATPFDRHMAGVEVHAAVVDAILSGRFVDTPPWTPGLQAVGIAVVGLICSLAFGRAKAFVYAPLAAGLTGGVLWGTSRAFLAGLFISPVYLVLTVAAEGFAVLSLRFWQEERQKRHLRQAFSRYVAPEIVARIAEEERDILAGEERVITILFSDIRGFTSLSESLRPPQLVRLLNSYFTPMTALVRGHKGTLDKFIGDALMAFWNAPLDVPDHPALAVETALRMQEMLDSLNATLQEQSGARIGIGIGLHTGPAYVGNMGSEELLDYTAIGDAVNLGSRLEGLCPMYKVGITVSGDCASLCGGRFAFQLVDVVRVKGKQSAVEVYTPLRPDRAAERKMELEMYAAARALYAAGEFQGAAEAFADLRAASSSGLYGVYEDRCRALAADPPPDWNGVWSLISK